MREFVNDHRTVLQVLAMGMGAFSIIFGRQLLGYFTKLAPFYRLLLAVIPTAIYYALLASIMDAVSAYFFSQVTGRALEMHLTPLVFAAGLAAVFASVAVAGFALASRSASGRETAPRSWSGRGSQLIVSWASFVLYVGFANYYVFTIQRWFGGHALPLPVVLAIALVSAVLALVVGEAIMRLESTSEPSSESEASGSEASGARFRLRLAVACALSLPVVTVYALDGAAAVVVARQVGWAFAIFSIGLGLGTGVYVILQEVSKDLEVATLSWIFGVPGALAALLGIVLTNVNVLPQ